MAELSKRIPIIDFAFELSFPSAEKGLAFVAKKRNFLSILNRSIRVSVGSKDGRGSLLLTAKNKLWDDVAQAQLPFSLAKATPTKSSHKSGERRLCPGATGLKYLTSTFSTLRARHCVLFKPKSLKSFSPYGSI